MYQLNKNILIAIKTFDNIGDWKRIKSAYLVDRIYYNKDKSLQVANLYNNKERLRGVLLEGFILIKQSLN